MKNNYIDNRDAEDDARSLEDDAWSLENDNVSPAPGVAQHNSVKDMQDVFPGKQPEAISTNTAGVAATSDDAVNFDGSPVTVTDRIIPFNQILANRPEWDEKQRPVSTVAATTGGSEAKHTPGPWKVQPYSGLRKKVISPDQFNEITNDKGTICFIYKNNWAHGWDQGNAELIARAPETAQKLKDEETRRISAEVALEMVCEERDLLQYSKEIERDLANDNKLLADENAAFVLKLANAKGELAALKALLREIGIMCITNKDDSELIQEIDKMVTAALADKTKQ